MVYNRPGKVGSGLYISVESILIKDNSAGQRVATAINDAYNKQFEYSIMGASYISSVAGFILSPEATPLLSILSAIADKAGDITTFFDVDVSYDLKVNERISWYKRVGYTTSAAIETNATIVRDKNGNKRN